MFKPNMHTVTDTHNVIESILMGKRNATIEFCQILDVVHKHKLHELTLARTLSKASGLLQFKDFCLSGMLANIHE